MLQKIKYPVGSKLKNDLEEGIIEEITPNGFACILNINDLKWNWLSQEELDHFDWKLVSSPARWIPKIGEQYWIIEVFFEDIGASEKIFTNNMVDKYFLKTNNIFRTSEECLKKIKEIDSREI